MATGTLTADGTEQVVDTLDPGVPGFVFYYFDLSAMQTEDEVVIREKADVDGDGTFELHRRRDLGGIQDNPIISQSNNLLVLSEVSVRVTIEQTEGTNRDFPYATGVKH